ncbi:MAG: hypothetical protein WBK28_02010 [Minisyncoccia bacterium]
MSRERTIVVLAVLIALAPFLGLPYSWLMWIEPLLAAVIILLSLFARSHYIKENDAPHESSL